MHNFDATRRRLLGSAMLLPATLLPACRASLPPMPSATDGEAEVLLRDAVAAHGGAALTALQDINVSYIGQWHRLVKRLQPELVDAGFRGGSEERLLPQQGLTAQSHTGSQGHKQVFRDAARGTVNVSFNGTPSIDVVRPKAAALVADAYGLFLLGPLWFGSGLAGRRKLILGLSPSEIVKDGAQRISCDVLTVVLRPGLGFASEDRLALYFDRSSRLMQRVRLTLDGLESTQGALVDVDTRDRVVKRGISWPTRFHERLLRPLPLEVHDWHLTGLDFDRGYDISAIQGPAFLGLAVPPASPV